MFYRATLIVFLICVACVGGCFFNLQYKSRQFAQLEQNAKKVIDVPELQTWAVKVLAEYPKYSTLQLNQLRTNYPPKLRSLAPGLGPSVFINEINSINSPEDWTNRPSSISLVWAVVFWDTRDFRLAQPISSVVETLGRPVCTFIAIECGLRTGTKCRNRFTLHSLLALLK